MLHAVERLLISVELITFSRLQGRVPEVNVESRNFLIPISKKALILIHFSIIAWFMLIQADLTPFNKIWFLLLWIPYELS